MEALTNTPLPLSRANSKTASSAPPPDYSTTSNPAPLSRAHSKPTSTAPPPYSTTIISPDPLYTSPGPRETGLCPVKVCHGTGGGCNLYYELRGDPASEHKIVMMMGAFSTLRWLDMLADLLANLGYEVMTFDNRGVGQSKAGGGRDDVASIHYTTDLLADDLWSLVDHVWGPEQAVHLYGMSMGGMTIQKATVQALHRRSSRTSSPPHRVLSLFLSATSRGADNEMWPRFYRTVLPPQLRFKIIQAYMPLAIVNKLSTLVKGANKERYVKNAIDKCFSRAYLSLPHPDYHHHDEDDDNTTTTSSKTMRDVWTERWVASFEEWSCFHDRDACAAHIAAFKRHYLTDEEADMVARSGIPVCVHVAKEDRLIKARLQWRLLQLLRAKHLVVTEGGHQGDDKNLGQGFVAQFERHYRQMLRVNTAGGGSDDQGGEETTREGGSV